MTDKEYLLSVAVKAARDRIELESGYKASVGVDDAGRPTGNLWVFAPDKDDSFRITVNVCKMPHA